MNLFKNTIQPDLFSPKYDIYDLRDQKGRKVKLAKAAQEKKPRQPEDAKTLYKKGLKAEQLSLLDDRANATRQEEKREINLKLKVVQQLKMSL